MAGLLLGLTSYALEVPRDLRPARLPTELSPKRVSPFHPVFIQGSRPGAATPLLMDGFERVLEVSERRRMTDASVIVRRIRRNISLFHRIHDRLYVTGPERHVIRDGRSTCRVEGDRGGGRAGRGAGAQLRVLELKERLDVEVFSPCLSSRLAGPAPPRRGAATDFSAEETISSTQLGRRALRAAWPYELALWSLKVIPINERQSIATSSHWKFNVARFWLFTADGRY